MNLKTFINRPVLSTVISIILVILGILGLSSLPITQYPDVAPPTIQVSATYTGANAETVLNSVIAPLEEQINGVEGMTYMTSTASNDGSASITVYFALGTNADMAAVNVQNRVSQASSLLPQEVTKVGVTTQKRMTSMLMVFTIFSENPDFDETFVQNYAKINVVPPIKRITGVGEAMAWGSKDYSMRIWLKPDVMATYGVSPAEVTAALGDQNIEAAPGKFGQNSNQSFQYPIKWKGRLKSAEEFENIVIRADQNGNILRLKDIARVELGGLDYSITTQSQGYPAVTVAVFQTPGSNANDIVKDVKIELEKAAKDFPKGIKYVTVLDTTDFLYASIDKVVETIIEAFILVFIVVYVFLQDFRSTLIPAIAVIVSLVGTFFFLKVAGFSLNLLTLFALVLAIAIVVDDAIVVVEAVHAKLDQGYKSPRKASIDAMSEISGAIISITLVMSAVFIPVTFVGGTTGVFYTQFGYDAGNRHPHIGSQRPYPQSGIVRRIPFRQRTPRTGHVACIAFPQGVQCSFRRFHRKIPQGRTQDNQPQMGQPGSRSRIYVHTVRTYENNAYRTCSERGQRRYDDRRVDGTRNLARTHG